MVRNLSEYNLLKTENKNYFSDYFGLCQFPLTPILSYIKNTCKTQNFDVKYQNNLLCKTFSQDLENKIDLVPVCLLCILKIRDCTADIFRSVNCDIIFPKCTKRNHILTLNYIDNKIFS